jgi:hypothetical protein
MTVNRPLAGLFVLPVLSLLVACGGVDDDELAEHSGERSAALCPATSPFCGRRPAPLPPQIYVPPPPPPASIQNIAANYAGFDINQDGVDEINALTLMSFEPQTMNSGSSGIVLVLVEPRLLESFTGSRRAEVLARLQTYRADLVAEGFRTRFFLADLYKGSRHQDGRILLALRRFLKQVRGSYPALRGVTLVGAFPDATLIRRPLVKFVNRKTTFDHGGEINGADYLELHPERITPRGDIVLGDLNGNWEDLYHETLQDLEWVKILPNKVSSFPLAGQTLTSSIYSYTPVPWEDFFYINDAQVTPVTMSKTKPASISIKINSNAQRHSELTSGDKAQANPIARPEITVSRINAKGQALTPSVPMPDLLGRQLLGTDGRPQPLVFNQDVDVSWSYDAVLEQRILIDYFDRNHAFRHGSNAGLPYRTAAVRQAYSGLDSPSSFNSFLRRADASFATSYAVDNATLHDFTYWLKQPAVLRGIAAHSSDQSSHFAEPAGQDLDSMMGGKVWAFLKQQVNGYTWIIPSWEALGTADHAGHPMRQANYSYYRTIFENNALASAGQVFYIHGGCDVNNPPHSAVGSYDQLHYGRRNTADNTMFFAKGLAIYSRGKVFYDLPDGFPERIKTAARFGYGWRGHFDHDAGASALNPGTTAMGPILSTKKAYFWGLRGDWTLKLKY